MQVQNVTYKRPKSKKSALKLVAFLLNQIEVKVKRRKNIMDTRNKVSEKIERLQKQLEEFDKQLAQIEKSGHADEVLLKELKLKFALTESEILEARTALLRSSLTETERQILTKHNTENI